MFDTISHEGNANQTMRYQFNLTMMAIIKKIDNNKRWGGYGEIITVIYYWWEYKMVQ